MPVRAVLFDFDGVLADTENAHVVAWQQTLGRMGWELTDEVAARAAELDDRAFLADLFQARGIRDGDVEGWCLRKQERTVEILADSPRVYPGVAELIGAISGRVRLAVVSSTWHANVRTVLEAAGLSRAFELVIAKEDLTALKPDPECYRLAVDRLGVSPGSALAIEDSPAGLAAARAADVRCLAVGHRRGEGPWRGDAPFVSSLSDQDSILALIDRD